MSENITNMYIKNITCIVGYRTTFKEVLATYYNMVIIILIVIDIQLLPAGITAAGDLVIACMRE